MNKFLETYKSDIIYVVIVLVIVLALYILTRVLHKWLHRKLQEHFPGSPVKSINLINRILKTLWLVLGVIALSLIFIKTEKRTDFIDYFKLFSYLGIISVITIVAITIANIWFNYKINKTNAANNDPTNYKFLRYVVIALISLSGVLLVSLAFPSLKGVAQTALGGAGILTLIAGFAAQEALANITGGLFIIAFKPFKIKDRIKVSDSMVGIVTDITLRHTVIRNTENRMIVIPNAVINKEKLINYDLGEHKSCEFIEMGISYESDIDLAKLIMKEECENHPLILDNRTLLEKKDNKPMVRTAVIELGDSSVNLRAWAWTLNYADAYNLKCDVLESIKKRFDEAGIDIPYPHRTVLMKAQD